MATLKSIGLHNINTSAQTLYTVPGTVNGGILKEIIFSNATNAIVKYSMIIVKNGGPTVTIIPSTKLLPYECNPASMSTFLQPGDIVQVFSDTASSVDTLLSYVEV